MEASGRVETGETVKRPFAVTGERNDDGLAWSERGVGHLGPGTRKIVEVSMRNGKQNLILVVNLRCSLDI